MLANITKQTYTITYQQQQYTQSTNPTNIKHLQSWC